MERMMGVTKSGPRQSSARQSSSKAGTVLLLANVGEAGCLWHGIGDEPTWGHCDFQYPGSWQTGHGLRGSGGPGQYCAKWPFRLSSGGMDPHDQLPLSPFWGSRWPQSSC